MSKNILKVTVLIDNTINQHPILQSIFLTNWSQLSLFIPPISPPPKFSSIQNYYNYFSDFAIFYKKWIFLFLSIFQKS